MRRTVLKSKIHRATVTATDLHYEGSLTIDANLLDASDILVHEQIHVWDVTNGTRLITYAIPGPRGSGTIQVNGAGAHLIKQGDILIIATFTNLKTRYARKYRPTIVWVDEQNRLRMPPSDLVIDGAVESAPAEVENEPDVSLEPTPPSDVLPGEAEKKKKKSPKKS